MCDFISEQNKEKCQSLYYKSFDKGIFSFYVKFLDQIDNTLLSLKSGKISKENKFYINYEIDYEFNVIIEDLIPELFNKLKNEMVDEIMTLNFINTIIVIVYLCLFILSFVVLFLKYIYPIAEELKNKFIITIKLLNIIPISVISKINSISNYLKNN